VADKLMHSLNTQTICEAWKREALGRVEAMVLKGLSTYLSSSLKFIEKLLSRQKSTEYRPREDQAILDGDSTQVIQGVAAFVRDQAEAIISQLSGKNLDTYLHVWGFRLYRLIIAHIKKFTITPTGALLLTRDVKELQEAVRDFHLASVDELFDRLRALINLLVVGVDNVRPLMLEDKKIGSFDPEEVNSFVKLRSDYGKSRLMNMLFGSSDSGKS